MKKLLSLVLVVLFACTALVACGESETAPAELNADTIVGTWKYEVDAKKAIGMNMNLEIEGSVEFKKNGTVITTLDMEKAIESLDIAGIAKMMGIDASLLESALESEGMSLDDIREQALEEIYKNVEEEEGITVKKGKVSMTHYYKLEDEKIYMSEDEDFEEEEGQEFTYKNGKIIMEEITLSK